MKHTPGPWRVGDGGATVFGPKSTQLKIVASLTRGLAGESTKANARLIAAAPELLESLESLVSVFISPGFEATTNAARAAIAKAKGGGE
jgi:hypothetical protein